LLNYNFITKIFFSKIRVYDHSAPKFPWLDILNKLKLTEGFPVVNLIGAKEVGRGKFYAGIARACFNTDSILLDTCIGTGIEKYAMRRGNPYGLNFIWVEFELKKNNCKNFNLLFVFMIIYLLLFIISYLKKLFILSKMLGVKLIGVAPENEVKFPKINPTFVDPYEISNGHTHLFLLSNFKFKKNKKK
jgi:hypothetical protein